MSKASAFSDEVVDFGIGKEVVGGGSDADMTTLELGRDDHSTGPWHQFKASKWAKTVEWKRH